MSASVLFGLHLYGTSNLILAVSNRSKIGKHPKKCTLYSIGFDCNFALAKTIKPLIDVNFFYL